VDPLGAWQDPTAFVASVDPDQEALRQKLEAARELLPKVKLTRDIRLKIRLGAQEGRKGKEQDVERESRLLPAAPRRR
jgi:Mg-chelatase subunit ChlI